MLKNKGLQWLLSLLYGTLFAWMWTHSKTPALHDVPLLFGGGLIVSLLCLMPFRNKNIKWALMLLNIALLIANIVMYFAAYRLVTGAFKN